MVSKKDITEKSWRNEHVAENYKILKKAFFKLVCRYDIIHNCIISMRVKNDLRIYDNIRKIATGQSDDYTTGYLPDYTYFKKYYKLIAIDSSKQLKLDAGLKAIQQINFIGSLDWAANTQMFLLIEEAKETVLVFSKGAVKLLSFYFILI